MAFSSYRVSKWLHYEMLLGEEELSLFLQQFAALRFFRDGEVVESGKGECGLKEFRAIYLHYLDSLIEDRPPVSLPALACTVDSDYLSRITLTDGRELLRPRLPVMQMRAHTFLLTNDGRLQSMALGKDAVRFGVQIAYPQLFMQDKQIVDVLKEQAFANNEPFRAIGKWTREYTKPTPLIVQGRKINAPFRIGRSVLSWLPLHRDLIRLNLGVGT